MNTRYGSQASNGPGVLEEEPPYPENVVDHDVDIFYIEDMMERVCPPDLFAEISGCNGPMAEYYRQKRAKKLALQLAEQKERNEELQNENANRKRKRADQEILYEASVSTATGVPEKMGELPEAKKFLETQPKDNLLRTLPMVEKYLKKRRKLLKTLKPFPRMIGSNLAEYIIKLIYYDSLLSTDPKLKFDCNFNCFVLARCRDDHDYRVRVKEICVPMQGFDFSQWSIAETGNSKVRSEEKTLQMVNTLMMMGINTPQDEPEEPPAKRQPAKLEEPMFEAEEAPVEKKRRGRKPNPRAAAARRRK